MFAKRCLLLSLFIGTSLALADGPSPTYTAAGIVNAADYAAGQLAPNTLASIFGTGLAYITKSATQADIRGGLLPTVLPGTGVHVLVGNLPANILYVSPKQINFLVPSSLLPGTVNVQVVLDSIAGPAIPVQILPAAPALFLLSPGVAVATQADGSLENDASPARPEGYAILYATGLGDTIPSVPYGEIPSGAAPIVDMADFQVTLDGVPVDRSRVEYAGVTPGFGGLYQINLKLPPGFNPNPEIRVGFPALLSPAGVRLPAQP